jgi:hypothetical protein
MSYKVNITQNFKGAKIQKIKHGQEVFSIYKKKLSIN